MFDAYALFEYLLKYAYSRKRIPYGKIHQDFDVNVDNSETRMIFYNTLELAERRIVDEVLHQEIVPIYTGILYRKKDSLPSIGFYDVFKNRNRESWTQIAGDKSLQDVFDDQKLKKEIFDVSMQALINDLDHRFSEQFQIDAFVAEVKIYRDINGYPL
jgi:hypothetical protein